MSRTAVVGSRELKTHLGQYLRRVRGGETILVTDRSEPVAELRPLTMSKDPTTVSLRLLAAAGTVTLGTAGAVAPFTPMVARSGKAAAAVSRDRDERG
jgi:prevent-host-death family protein